MHMLWVDGLFSKRDGIKAKLPIIVLSEAGDEGSISKEVSKYM